MYFIKYRSNLNENLLPKKVIAMPITHEFFKTLQQNLILNYPNQTSKILLDRLGVKFLIIVGFNKKLNNFSGKCDQSWKGLFERLLNDFTNNLYQFHYHGIS